jgi:hypothetical protein
MNKKEIQRYFDRRPAAQELYVVNDIPFIDPQDAAIYAGRVGSVVETCRRDVPEEEQETEVTEEVAAGLTPAEDATEPQQVEVVEEIQEQIAVPVKTKNSPRKKSVK